MDKSLIERISEGRVKVLRVGKEQENGKMFYAPASITLIIPKEVEIGTKKEENHYFLVDPGCFGEEATLSRLLEGQGIRPSQISTVFATHAHPDHIGTIGMFRIAGVFMPDSSFCVGAPNFFKLMPQEFYVTPGKSFEPFGSKEPIKIMSTPGHCGQDTSIIYTRKDGIIAIVGDLFWSQEDWENDTDFRALCVNPDMQKRSREYVREVLRPEVIVPGHGPAFEPKYH